MNGRVELTGPYLVTIDGSNSTDFLDIGTQVIEFAPAQTSSSSSSRSSSSSSAQGLMAPITGVTKIFVATSGGNDANDGGDLLGLDVQFADWTASTKRITRIGAFSSYTFVPGDKIYLSHASITDDRYEIASKISGDIIELVDSIFGSDLTDVQSSNGPLATITSTVSVVAPGDQIFLCTMADGEKFDSGSETFPIVFNIAGSDTVGYIAWYGADSQGTIGTIAVVDAGASGTVINVGSSANKNLFFYIRAQNGSNGWDLTSSNFNYYFRCEGFNNSADGFNVATNNATMVECHADNNSTYGFHMGLFDHHCIGCVASNNGDRGFNNAFIDTGNFRERAERCSQIFSVAYNDPGGTAQDIGFKRPRFMANCVAHNNNDDGISFFGELFRRYPVVINCIATDNAAYGVDDEGMPLILLNNGFANNGTGETRNTPVYEQGRIDLEDTPFQSVANDNFTLDRGSRSGLLAQTRGVSVVAFKKPANEVASPGFAVDSDWTGSNWTIANGVASHSSGSTAGFENSEAFVVSDTLYETFFTVKNYIAGNVAITVGATAGTNRSANGVYREILDSATVTPGSNDIVELTPDTNFVGDIDDVFVAPLHSGPGTGTKFSTQSHLGVAFPKDRLIKVQ